MAVKQDSYLKLLVEKIKNDDETAFKKFYFNFKAEIFRFFYRHIFLYDASEDLTQETFIKFWEARTNLDSDKNPKAYLFKIARNNLINHQQRKKSHSPLSEISEASFSKKGEIIHEDLVWSDIKKGISKLPERCRTTFILKRYHQLNNQEIAEVMNVSEKTVKNQLTRGIKLLRDYFNS
jgi:RNA polymerase sigma-70 factor (ECF subfamily)